MRSTQNPYPGYASGAVRHTIHHQCKQSFIFLKGIPYISCLGRRLAPNIKHASRSHDLFVWAQSSKLLAEQAWSECSSWFLATFFLTKRVNERNGYPAQFGLKYWVRNVLCKSTRKGPIHTVKIQLYRSLASYFVACTELDYSLHGVCLELAWSLHRACPKQISADRMRSVIQQDSTCEVWCTAREKAVLVWLSLQLHGSCNWSSLLW